MAQSMRVSCFLGSLERLGWAGSMNERPDDCSDDVGGYPNIDCFWQHGSAFGSFRASLYDFHYDLIIRSLGLGYQNGHHLRFAG